MEHTDIKAAGVEVGAKSFVSFKWNKVSPLSRPSGQALPQGTLLGQRVKDAGKSECRSVMERIGVATSLRCESRQTSSWSWLTKELTESLQEEIANELGAIYVCSLRP